jgi:hypothetical protein
MCHSGFLRRSGIEKGKSKFLTPGPMILVRSPNISSNCEERSVKTEKKPTRCDN